MLADESGRPGVVLHGMAGAGKTACALELAYTHERSFPLMAWFAAPPEASGGVEIAPVSASFALATERQLPGLRWAHLVDDPEKLRGFLPQLTQVFEEYRILLVLDNLESLLTEGGAWRDERWGWVLAADGSFGVVAGGGDLAAVAGRAARRSVGGAGARVVAGGVGAAGPGAAAPARVDRRNRASGGTVSEGTGRAVAARVLGVVQGHPKLLELADGAAADPGELQARLADADAAWLARGTRLDGFLRDGAATASDADFGAVLAGWARSAAAGLPGDAGLLLRVVCGLDDREPNVLDVVWPDVWERTGQAGSPPNVDAVVPALVVRALVAEERDPESGVVVGWRVHPGVADAVRADTDPALAGVVDEVAGDGWLGTLQAARAREAEERVGAWVVRAARSAAHLSAAPPPLGDLNLVAQEVLARDPGVGAAVVLAPMLQVAADATRGGDPERELSLGRTHARVVLRLDPARGMALLEQLLGVAVAAGRYDNASTLAGDLVTRYAGEGRYTEALDLVDRQVDYSRRAGFGPWTQLVDQTQRLQIEYLQGRYREVLDEVEESGSGWPRCPPSPTGPPNASTRGTCARPSSTSVRSPPGSWGCGSGRWSSTPRTWRRCAGGGPARAAGHRCVQRLLRAGAVGAAGRGAGAADRLPGGV